MITVPVPLFREAFWHIYAKIPRVVSQNSIAKGDFHWILAVTVKVLNSYSYILA